MVFSETYESQVIQAGSGYRRSTFDGTTALGTYLVASLVPTCEVSDDDRMISIVKPRETSAPSGLFWRLDEELDPLGACAPC